VDERIGFDNFDAFARAGRLAECRAFLDNVYGVMGESPHYLLARAKLHSRWSEFGQVLEICEQIAARFPEFLNHRYVMGAAAAHLGETRPVVATLSRCAALTPNQVKQVRAELLHVIGWDDDVLAIEPVFEVDDHPAAMTRLVRAQSLMRRYGIAAGLNEYATAWAHPRQYATVYGMSDAQQFQDFWYGDLGLPQTLTLAHVRGGYGDAFMWQRYLPYLQEAGVRIEYSLNPAPSVAMRPIDAPREQSGVARLRAWFEGRTEEAHRTMWVDAFTLFAALYPALGYCDVPGGFLTAAPSTQAAMTLDQIRARAGDRPCIGISWSANESASETFAGRSLTVQQMLPLLARTDIQWVVFQRGVQRNVWLANEASEAAWNVDPAISWDDTASIVAGLDAVVTIDTALAHLSAGLGQHTFMLLSTAFDWRWESLPRTTPWYSSMRLVRQPSLGDWAGAVADLQAALSDWIRTGRMAQRGEEGVS
jgi:hypothetical protein